MGFNITIPFDIRFNNSIESAKIEYLKKKAQKQSIYLQEESFYNNIVAKINSIDKKIAIAKSDYKLYDSLVNEMIELKNGGFKTLEDIKTMQNSKDIKALDIEILKFDKQLQLLELYSRIDDEI